VVGDGVLRPSVEKLCAELGLNEAVTFWGERADTGAFFNAADVCVLSSKSEGLPISLLEAMAAGRPVVAAAPGAVPEIVEGADVASSSRLVPSWALRKRFCASQAIHLYVPPWERRRASTISNNLLRSVWLTDTLSYIGLVSERCCLDFCSCLAWVLWVSPATRSGLRCALISGAARRAPVPSRPQ